MVRGELSSLVNLMIPMEWARPEIWVFWGKSTAFMRLGSGAHVTALENSLFVTRSQRRRTDIRIRSPRCSASSR
jgi:hypothetical protein